MSKTIREVMSEKLQNFKHLICVHCTNEDNENFKKLMEYDVDQIIYFYEENVSPYISFGHQTIIRSFLSHINITKDDETLNAKLEQYFKFFQECIDELKKETDDLDVNKCPK